MSKILSKDVRKVVYKKVRELEGIKCDICGKIIPAGKMVANDDSKYFSVTTGHLDWGNDSCESREHLDVCPDCLVNFVGEYFNSVRGYTDYLEVETEHVYGENVGNEEA